ncbi:MAG: hypothetical protein KAJ75_06150 [Alphaproteobacteria bacterium]|nr:hypothetical protein [Alphaproteobacteria bacterium]
MAVIKITMPNDVYEAYQDAFAEIYQLDPDKEKNLDMAVEQYVNDIYGAGQMQIDAPIIRDGTEDEIDKTKNKIKDNQSEVEVT